MTDIELLHTPLAMLQRRRIVAGVCGSLLPVLEVTLLLKDPAPIVAWSVRSSSSTRLPEPSRGCVNSILKDPSSVAAANDTASATAATDPVFARYRPDTNGDSLLHRSENRRGQLADFGQCSRTARCVFACGTFASAFAGKCCDTSTDFGSCYRSLRHGRSEL